MNNTDYPPIGALVADGPYPSTMKRLWGIVTGKSELGVKIFWSDGRTSLIKWWEFHEDFVMVIVP